MFVTLGTLVGFNCIVNWVLIVLIGGAEPLTNHQKKKCVLSIELHLLDNSFEKFDN